MKNTAYTKAFSDVAGTPPPLMQAGSAASEVCLRAAQNIQLIQVNAGSEFLGRQLDSLATAFSPDGARYWVQQLPQLVQQQIMSLMKSAGNTVGELWQANQALMEVGNQALWQSVRASADTLTQALKKTYTRRVASQVISFPDRRAA